MIRMFPGPLVAAVLIFVLPGIFPAVASAGVSVVAGLAPHQRPQGAPIIREFAVGSDWRARALTGIAAPVPPSMAFLDHQGAWHTPFILPGMPGYYDLRQWHNAPAKAKAVK